MRLLATQHRESNIVEAGDRNERHAAEGEFGQPQDQLVAHFTEMSRQSDGKENHAQPIAMAETKTPCWSVIADVARLCKCPTGWRNVRSAVARLDGVDHKMISAVACGSGSELVQ